MDTSIPVMHSEYIQSTRSEYRLTNNETPISLQFPSSLEKVRVRIMGKCMKVDHVIIEYRNQVPFNAQGSVIVTIRDTRLSEEQQDQAQFTFPIGCNVDLHYFSASFFSLEDKAPWELFYKVEDSNVKDGVTFAQIKAKLKLSSATHSTDIRFKQPTIKILSKDYNADCVDFWSVGKPKPIRRLINPGPTTESSLAGHYRAVQIQPGETWATKSTIGRSSSMRLTTSQPMHTGSTLRTQSACSDAEFPLQGLHKLPEASLDPGDSISQTTSNALSKADIESIVEQTVNKCLIAQRGSSLKNL
ncbi:MP [Desmodium mottle virus]|uniref:Movement protein BC1 n=1 Tax=Desmodium mottle virus TaxID=1960710 RepID=A0A1S6GND0_9GEMI|nr:MP [Desmodium mottle virus]AQS23371.1 MP [Desmodium mottle virus]AQS23373.1 MP [Desmodium mottle virus]